MTGTITKISYQKRDPSRVSIFLDGEFAFGIHQDVLLEHGLRTGQHLAEDEVERLQEADQYYAARAVALNYASHRPRTVHEVRQKLRRAEYQESAIVPVLERLAELNYLDDVAYAHAYVRGRVRGRGYGPRRIGQELRRRGVDAAIIEEALASEIDDDETRQHARKQASRRWQQLQRETDPLKRRAKLTGFLLRRGFAHDLVRTIVDELAASE